MTSGARGRPVRVLDVGGGYGALSAEVLDQLPTARVVLHDYSAAMIAVARQRLAGFGGRVSYTLADMTRPDWIHGLGGPFDIVVSALAIHNLGEPALIGRVDRDLFGLLRPGGDLFNLDVLFPAGLSQALVEQAWRESGLGQPDGTGQRKQQITQLSEHDQQLRAGLAERDQDLAAARAASRELGPASTLAAG